MSDALYVFGVVCIAPCLWHLFFAWIVIWLYRGAPGFPLQLGRTGDGGIVLRLRRRNEFFETSDDSESDYGGMNRDYQPNRLT